MTQGESGRWSEGTLPAAAVGGGTHLQRAALLLRQVAPQLRHALGHHRHHVGVAAVDLAQHAGEAVLVGGVLDAREGAQLLERLDVPVPHLRAASCAGVADCAFA